MISTILVSDEYASLLIHLATYKILRSRFQLKLIHLPRLNLLKEMERSSDKQGKKYEKQLLRYRK